jgi:hypothetical protein
VSIQVENVVFRIGDELVTRYHVGPNVAKPYLWPLNAPGGIAVTRPWPMDKTGAISTDHVHQKSSWFCHGDVIPEGMALTAAEKSRGVEGVDFWTEGNGKGKIVCVEVSPAEGNRLRTRNEWRTATGRKVLDETSVISLHDLGDARLIVVSSDLHASVVPIVFGDTKEGSFGVRVHDKLRVGEKAQINPKSRLTNSEGKEGEKAVWGYAANWCDCSGELDGKPVGVAVFDDTRNPVRAYWHAREYGLLAANPFGRDKSFPGAKGRTDLAKIAKGEHLKLRYGILMHSGDVKSGKVAECYEQFLKLKD